MNKTSSVKYETVWDKNKVQGHFDKLREIPPSPSSRAIPPSTDTLSLISLSAACILPLLSSPINVTFKLKARSFSPPLAYKTHPFDLPYKLATVGHESGQNFEQTSTFSVGWGIELAIKTCPRYGHELDLLIAAIFYKLGYKSLPSNTQSTSSW